MDFFDCNLFYGPDRFENQLVAYDNLDDIKAGLDRAGISGGLIFRADYETTRANRDLIADLREETRLYGILQLLPSMTEETPSPAQLPAFMKENRLAAVMFRPSHHRFMVPFAITDYLTVLQAHRIPVMLNSAWGMPLEKAAEIMEQFPMLTAVLTYNYCWPNDRLLRPFLERFPNLYLDMTYLLTDYGIPPLVERYGGRRILFGSGYPESYLGAHMMVIKHAEICEEDKKLIAGGNFRRLFIDDPIWKGNRCAYDQ